MVAIKGYFDGRVIVPEEPVDLPRNQRLMVHVEPLGEITPPPAGVSGKSLLSFAGTISPDDLQAMSQAIEGECEKVHPDEW